MSYNEEVFPTDPPLTQREEINAALLRRWLLAGWEANDSSLVDEHFHPQCIVSGLAPEVIEGVDEMRATHRAMCARLNHRSATLHFLVIRGDQFAVSMEFEGRQQDSGIDVALESACFGTMKDGLIYRAHNIIDYTGLYSKLGLLDTRKLAEHFG
ncbi:SnoaL-like domain protein [Rubripirellula amarantea]|uniref:SnoaL-like domain protein n=1 Tax=Rubripirellula amarantea TaxID=2527999 RepID=A0A5C5WLI6_9BACT|nr:nuclear transport factor 2 family protein [Rubripirellula amarantea]TWT50632.1 SnoaL-like domain protein [Rubripirellula amarantea]